MCHDVGINDTFLFGELFFECEIVLEVARQYILGYRLINVTRGESMSIVVAL